MKHTIKSRYGKPRTFEVKDDHVLLTFESIWLRAGSWNPEDNKTGLRFVDPDGGPFVAVGTNLQEYHKSLPNKVISKIEAGDGGYILNYE